MKLKKQQKKYLFMKLLDTQHQHLLIQKQEML